MLDFEAVSSNQITLQELVAGLTRQDLQRLTNEMIDTLLELVSGATDAEVTFVPVDEQAEDAYAADEADKGLAWTLGHVIVHTTASAEESAALAAELARGVPLHGRSRYETPWQTVHTIAQVRQRLEESRRIRQAYLQTWPDQPHLELLYTPDHPDARPRNAILQFVLGLRHEHSHLDQIREILRQADLAGAATE